MATRFYFLLLLPALVAGYLVTSWIHYLIRRLTIGEILWSSPDDSAGWSFFLPGTLCVYEHGIGLIGIILEWAQLESWGLKASEDGSRKELYVCANSLWLLYWLCHSRRRKSNSSLVGLLNKTHMAYSTGSHRA